MIVAENGRISESYDEKKLKEYMEWESIEIEINLNSVMMHLNAIHVILLMII
jgi:N-acetylglutamate synthase/N-acetylornithine aminotransferase